MIYTLRTQGRKCTSFLDGSSTAPVIPQRQTGLRPQLANPWSARTACLACSNPPSAWLAPRCRRQFALPDIKVVSIRSITKRVSIPAPSRGMPGRRRNRSWPGATNSMLQAGKASGSKTRECASKRWRPSKWPRLHAVLEVLATGRAVPIETIDIVSFEERLPLMWQRLLMRLRAGGITIRGYELQTQTGDSDLVAMQCALRGEKAAKFAGDGSLIILDADDEWQPADAVAAWLSSGENRETVIVRGAGCQARDAACRRLGLPFLGFA